MPAPESSSPFGLHLRQIRVGAGLTQDALAGRAGISKRAIQHLERGLGQPLRETARRLMQAFDLRGDQLRQFEALAAPAPRRRRPAAHGPTLPVPDGAWAAPGIGPERAISEGERQDLNGLMLSFAERKQVTVVVTEVVEPAALFEMLELAEAIRLLDTVLSAMRAALHQYGGPVTSIDHGGLTVLFSATASQHENAVSACRTALAMLVAVARFTESLHGRAVAFQGVRVGVASGEVALRTINAALSADYMVAGHPMHSASRLARLTSPASAWIEHETARLVAGHVPMRALRPILAPGSDLPIQAFELLSAPDDAEGVGVSQAADRVLSELGAAPA